MKIFYHFGKYLILLKSVISRPERRDIYLKLTIDEMEKQGVNSMGIVFIISIFMGAVITIQTAYQLVSGLIPSTVIGSIVTDSTILELAPTVTSLVLAGRIGSSIATEIGSMRVSEQIDALEVMGINSASYLILPKIIACLIMLPLLIILSIAIGISGGMLAGNLTGIVSYSEFLTGARETFRIYTLFFSLTKAFTFAFLISSISSYQGYYTHGGALEVGQASTKAIVYSSIMILVFDYVLAQLFL